MKYFVLAGEASGDKQAALLCASIFNIDKDAIIKGWGGDRMMLQGVNVSVHYSKLAYMGFVEVVRHLPAILRNFRIAKKEILEFTPDALILVDYPGFNLRMAMWAFKNNIPVYYYISPQLWAWHTSRVHKIKESVRKMYVILPFEKDFYKKFDYDVMYIGHPLALEHLHEIDSNKSIIHNQVALLPGSRKNEIELILPEMIALAKLAPDLHFKIIAVKHLPEKLYRDLIGNQTNVELIDGDMYNVLQASEAAIVTSGTATLEAALAGTPQVVVYKGNSFSYQIAKRLVRVPFISLVNLIANKELVPELIQNDCNANAMYTALKKILTAAINMQIRSEYKLLTLKLTDGGGAYAAAKDIITDLQSKN